MKRLFIKDLKHQAGKKVQLKGWVHKIKKFKHFTFVILRDKTDVIQLIIDDPETVSDLKLESSIEVIGITKISPQSQSGLELQVMDFKVVGQAHYDLLPFSVSDQKVTATLETQLDYPSMRFRRLDTRSIFKVQHEIVKAFRSYLEAQSFSEIHTPKIIGTETEGGAEVFTVDYFGKRTFLAQSPQFYKQMMVGAGFERVFEIGHAYRAELSSTWRHLTEYVSLDVEMGFIESDYDLMDLEEGFLKYLLESLAITCDQEFALKKITLPVIDKIPRIPLDQAREILLEHYGKASPKGTLDAEGEKLFAAYVKDHYKSDFVFLTKYPKSKRPFYTKPDDDFPETTKSFDLIFKGLEITTGGQRIHDYKELYSSIVDFGSQVESFDFYLDSFKYGMPPHGGFAIGLERLTMMLLDLDTIKEATLIPRDIGRVKP